MSEMQPRYEPHGVEERWQQTWEAEGLYNADPDPSRDAVRRRAPAAQRHRRAAHGPRAPARDRRHGHPHEADAGLQHALPARLRPRGHLDAERRRERARQRGHVAPGARPRGVRRARVGVAARVRRQDPGPVPPHGRVARLPPHALHDGRRVHPRRDALLRASLPARLDLPREPDHQLVPVITRRRSPTSSSSTSTSTTRCRRFAIRSRTATGTSRSRRCGRRRSPPTSRSPCIPTTSGTSI